MASTDDVESELEIKRPRRSCTQKQGDENEISENSDSEISLISVDNSSDEDFSLTNQKKRTKKKKKIKKKVDNKEGKFLNNEYAYDSVMKAHGELEQKLAERSYNESCNDYSSDEKSESNIEEPPASPEKTSELLKKKRIVIRPWNPIWYQIHHEK